MNKKGPLLIIDDDKDDRDILAEVFDKLGCKNILHFFDDGRQALDYLQTTDDTAFLIFSDINMPKMNGLELREIIQSDERLRKKAIPYIYFTTAITKKAVLDAYDLSVQGLFIKPNSFGELEEIIRNIISYWKNCKSPSDYL